MQIGVIIHGRSPSHFCAWWFVTRSDRRPVSNSSRHTGSEAGTSLGESHADPLASVRQFDSRQPTARLRDRRDTAPTRVGQSARAPGTCQAIAARATRAAAREDPGPLPRQCAASGPATHRYCRDALPKCPLIMIKSGAAGALRRRALRLGRPPGTGAPTPGSSRRSTQLIHKQPVLQAAIFLGFHCPARRHRL